MIQPCAQARAGPTRSRSAARSKSPASLTRFEATCSRSAVAVASVATTGSNPPAPQAAAVPNATGAKPIGSVRGRIAVHQAVTRLTDPGAGVPGWLVDVANKTSVPDVLRAFAGRATSGLYEEEATRRDDEARAERGG